MLARARDRASWGAVLDGAGIAARDLDGVVRALVR
jgi:hypothetical protein